MYNLLPVLKIVELPKRNVKIPTSSTWYMISINLIHIDVSLDSKLYLVIGGMKMEIGRPQGPRLWKRNSRNKWNVERKYFVITTYYSERWKTCETNSLTCSGVMWILGLELFCSLLFIKKEEKKKSASDFTTDAANIRYAAYSAVKATIRFGRILYLETE